MITVSGRTLTIPDNEKFIGFEGDHNIETRQFEITEARLFDLDFKLDLQTRTTKGIVDLVKTINEDKIILTWTVGQDEMQYSGRTYIQLRAFSGSDLIWHSNVDYFTIGDSINATDYFPPVLPTEFIQMESRVTAIQADVTAKSVQVSEYAAQVSADKQTVSGYVDTVNTKAGEAEQSASAAALSAGEAADKVIVSTEKVNGELLITYADGTIVNVGNVNGRGVSGISQSGETLTITYTDGTTGEFTVQKGDTGNGISGIEKNGETMTVSYTDGTQNTFTVHDGHTPVRGTDYWTTADINAINAYLDNARLRPLKYGELIMPDDFTPVLPCKFYRDNDGTIKHNMNFDKYKTGTKIYVASTGNDTTGNGTESQPYKTLTKAAAVAVAGADPAYLIIVSNPILGRYECEFNQSVSNKTIAIVSTVGTLITTNASYAWTADGTGTYRTARSNGRNVIDRLNLDLYGLPVPLKMVTSLDACQSTKDTWYTDNVDIWVHRNDEAAPNTSNTIVNIAVAAASPSVGEGGIIYFENLIATIISEGAAITINASSGVPRGEVCFNSCKFIGSKHITRLNRSGLSINGVKAAHVFNCVAAYPQLDGFNYHYTYIDTDKRRDCFALEYNCKAYDCGLEVSGNISNASSIHEGANILRIGTVGHNTTGPVITDVGGCYSVLYDCHARKPAAPSSIFGFDGGGTGTGKTYMINCSASEGDKALSVNTGQTVYLNNFRYDGSIINTGTIIYI